MRLKSIKLAGFKSFVDPTTVNFPSNLCAVVGPNGCGKSNIIDAVRWVMGESSAKNLRGESMTDVIFNGSNARKPIGQASIELVFDNSEGKLVGEYASFTEISVKRKVTRDLQNIYYLNGAKCRRRDITDIFLGTGLGPRSYAIIEQGMISRLIESKPEELRVFVEEAAGISKYKERRRDTENRMRRTMENLERLSDLREELTRQLSRLERQAQSAEKYKVFKAEERELKAKLHAVRFQSLQKSGEQRKQSIRDLELRVEAAVTDRVHYDSTIEIKRTEYSEVGDAFNEVQGRFYSIGGDIARLEQTIQHIQERERQLQTDLHQAVKDCDEASEHLALDESKAEGWQVELLEIEPELERLKEAELTTTETLERAEADMQNWQQQWDSFNQSASQPRQQAEVQQSRIQHLEQVQQRLLERTRRLQDEKQQFQVDGAEAEIELVQEQLAELELQLDEADQVADSQIAKVQEYRDSEREISSKLHKARELHQQAKGRQASLEALQQAALSQGGKEVDAWLENAGIKEAKRLAEDLRVTPGWETAVETALGHFLQAVCIDEAVEYFADELQSVTKGEIILVSSTSAGRTESNSETLLSKVEGTAQVGHLLDGILVADSLPEAMKMRPSLKGSQSIMTADGIWIGANWARVAKDKDASSGMIERKQLLEALDQEIIEQSEQLDTLSTELDECKQNLRSAEAQREDQRKLKEQLVRQQSEAKAQLSQQTSLIDKALSGKRRAEKEIGELSEQMEHEAESLAEARAILQEAIEAMEVDTEEREVLLSKRDDLREKLDGARQQARHDKDRAHEMALRYQSVKTQLSAISQGIERLSEQMARMTERRQKLEAGLEDSREPVDDHKLELEAKLEARISVEEELAKARTTMETVEGALRESEKNRDEVDKLLQGLRTSLEQERMDAKTLDVQGQSLREQLAEDDLDLDDVLASLEEGITESGLSEEIRVLESRISRLGAINLAAIDEYKTESERKTYLDEQNNDLQEALETLENAIKKIDRETRTRFKETFDKINSGIQELFPKVFGGGHAYLELTGEDLLDTGIAIMARPPGKRNSTIHLLSGGEKALTAIALVFSIFRLNPAPFCMLDEVDAPLDDANVGRYAKMVEEMSKHVQFIYITHNKIAMEMAHQLMGVTMHEPGVSRIVTVDVDEAAELATQ